MGKSEAFTQHHSLEEKRKKRVIRFPFQFVHLVQIRQFFLSLH
jgi:hypothetical protein